MLQILDISDQKLRNIKEEGVSGLPADTRAEKGLPVDQIPMSAGAR
jgi:hypothetical protein